ncbi:hypothetical protein Prudu_004406, partial [Prunus dulcis]
RLFDFQATARPPQAEPISGKGTVGSASLSPTKPDRPPPLGHPELIEKPCFPTEVRPSPPDFPARISPSFLHQIDRVRHQRSGRPQPGPSKGRRSARDPPPGPFKASATPRENFGIGQNTGETLSKFRQKSKENLKRI